MADRVASRQEEAREAQLFAEMVAWASPAVALTLAFERLAGMGPEAASAFQAYTMEAVEQRVHWILRHAWKKVPVDQSDFDALVDDSPVPFRWDVKGMSTPGLALALWSLATWLLAMLGLSRAERRM